MKNLEECLATLSEEYLESTKATGLVLTKVARNFIRNGVIPGKNTSLFILAIDFYDFCKTKEMPDDLIVEYSKIISPFKGMIDDSDKS